MKTLIYGISVIALLFSGMSFAEENGEHFFDLIKIFSYHKTNKKPQAEESDVIYISDNKDVGIKGKNGSCRGRLLFGTKLSHDEKFTPLISERAGGDDALDRTLMQNMGIRHSDFTYQIFGSPSYTPPSKGTYCNLLIDEGIFYATRNGDIVIFDKDYAYFFKYRIKNTREPQMAEGDYATTQLPISDTDIECESMHCAKRFIRYDNIPKKLANKNFHIGMDFFYKLPPIGGISEIGGIEVYIGGYYEEHEVEENGRITTDSVDNVVYLITLKGNMLKGDKINYVHLGKKFLIDKDYSIIEGTDVNGKPAKFAIKSNGVIIKKP